MAYIALIIAQTLYTASDAWKKVLLGAGGFTAQTLVKPAFIATMVIAGIGFLFQMYALSRMDLSRTIITMGMLAVVLSAAVGAAYFHERISALNLVGVALALGAIVLVNLR